MNVNPGELNKKIRIVSFEKCQDEKNQDKKKEILVRETYAKVTRTKVSEAMKAEREINIIKCRFLVRYSPVEITRKMFVSYQGKYYQIEYANNYGDSNEYIEIMTEGGMV